MFKLKSIKTKLSFSFGALLIIICAGLGIASYVFSANAMVSIIDETLSQLAREASKVVRERVNTHLNALEAVAETDAIKGDSLTLDEKLKLLDREAKRSGHTRMFIADTEGNIKDYYGTISNISDREYFKRALDGEKVVSDPVISRIDNSFSLAFAVPIRDRSNVITGVLIAQRDGNELSEITDDIRFGKESYAIMVNGEGAIIANPDRNLVLEGYNYIEAAKEDPGLREVAALVQQMVERKEGVGEYKYQGVAKYMGFAPVTGTNWSISITSPKSEVMEKVNGLSVTMTILSIIFLAASVLIVLFLATSISKPIKEASEFISVVATGDFTREVPERLLNMTDETGVLANSIGTMQQSIREILKEVVNESSNTSRMLIDINAEMDRLNKSIEDISATTEELSAGTEETAASTEEMNATSAEIEKAVESIADKAQEGAITVGNVYKMSEEMRQNAILSRENTVSIYGRTKDSLQRAIEQSKAVTQINELSDAILAITSQTNLLALNAAIEAARAGEAGKGFAVVADEIRKLAESSKNTVTRIQEVTNVILEAVNNLSDSSGEMLEFIDKQVLNDYEYLVKAGEQYNHDASSINDMMTDFSATSEELLASVQNMAKAINEIATASNEEAQAASTIAQETSAIMLMVDKVNKLAESARERSEMLINAVSRFKV